MAQNVFAIPVELKADRTHLLLVDESPDHDLRSVSLDEFDRLPHRFAKGFQAALGDLHHVPEKYLLGHVVPPCPLHGVISATSTVLEVKTPGQKIMERPRR
ncbi:hypothetical protein Q1M64_32430 [Sinorhizobium meliloti]|nr:hypothetical protein Q1M63_34060 [Sinorhizobium meliloti]WKL41167.1 hypothetical protein Q1M64_32430 [Sinorhizobium meliloti]